MRSSLSVRELSMSFGSNRVLDRVSFDVPSGSVLALVGQNGSGKSTLVKLLAGHHTPAPGGQILLGERDVRAGGQYDTLHAHEAGFRFIHQNLNLIPDLTGLENVAVTTGWVRTRSGRIDWKRSAERVRSWCEEMLGRTVELNRPVRLMSRLDQLMIALARALMDAEGADVLVLDEATVGLPAQQWDVMRELIAHMRDTGMAVLYITHNLEEIPVVADRLIVLRDGRIVLREETSEWDEDKVVRTMAGRDVVLSRERTTSTARKDDDVLVATGLSGEVVRDVDFALPVKGIVGVTGTIGSGASELSGLLSGFDRPRGGRVDFRPDGGDAVSIDSYAAARRLGVAFLPDRSGTFRDLTVRENLSMTDFSHCWNGAFLSARKESSVARSWMQAFEIRPGDPDQQLGLLSGGNRQKVALARLLRLDPRVLIMEEPTQGVDAAAKQDIYRLLQQNRDTGTSMLVMSGDYQELALLCSTVSVMHAGRIVETLSGDITPAEIEDAVLGAGRAIA